MGTTQPAILAIPDLAAYMGTTEAAIRSKLQRKCPDIPPPFRIGRNLRWRRETVDAWFRKKDVKAQKALGRC
jgi:predicted DNA-binding transcriptional regulator AlpA